MEPATDATARFADVTRLLAPRTVAVIGASDQPGNIGGAAVRFFGKFASPCTVWPVNRGRDTVAGLACYPSVAELPAPADLAILAVPATAVLQVVRDCAAAGIRAGIAWAGGFVEGGSEGMARQAELAALCRETGFALLGPNCIGIIDTHVPITASFALMMLNFDRFLPGNISMVSQSGGLATMGQAMAQLQGYGFRYMISTGNEAVLEVADFIHALAADNRTKIIATYLEGVRNGAKFRRALLDARDAGKPVIVLKAGATPASKAAAAAHTGALAGEGRVWDAVLRDCAAIQVESLEELLDIAMQLSGADLSKLPRSRGVAAVTFGGGSGVLSADQCDRVGLNVPALTADTRTALQDLVPPLASTRNPVVLTPQAYQNPQWLELFPQALDVIAADPGVGMTFFQLGPMARGDLEMTHMVAAFRTRCAKPVVAAWPLMIEAAGNSLHADGVHVFPEYSRAVRTMGRLADYADARATERESVPAASFDWSAELPIPQAGTIISEHACHAILTRAGLPVAAGRLAQSEDAAVDAARAVGFPVVMKGISSAVTHRAAAGLLALGLRSEAEVRATWRTLRTLAASLPAALDGILVQHMMQEGAELLVSAFRDPDFGVMLSVGAGGTLTELLDDVVLVPAPVSRTAATSALRRLRVMRKAGDPPNALLDFLCQFSELSASAPWQRFVLEVNPVKWTKNEARAVDGCSSSNNRDLVHRNCHVGHSAGAAASDNAQRSAMQALRYRSYRFPPAIIMPSCGIVTVTSD
jgi:acetate---CoA ligase (ADP-forming)